ncbi:hypothetical protein HAX54_022369, partial [Datura stramonium]|nr:hypothetical protein [Datura stramonium]
DRPLDHPFRAFSTESKKIHSDLRMHSMSHYEYIWPLVNAHRSPGPNWKLFKNLFNNRSNGS